MVREVAKIKEKPRQNRGLKVREGKPGGAISTPPPSSYWYNKYQNASAFLTPGDRPKKPLFLQGPRRHEVRCAKRRCCGSNGGLRTALRRCLHRYRDRNSAQRSPTEPEIFAGATTFVEARPV